MLKAWISPPLPVSGICSNRYLGLGAWTSKGKRLMLSLSIYILQIFLSAASRALQKNPTWRNQTGIGLIWKIPRGPQLHLEKAKVKNTWVNIKKSEATCGPPILDTVGPSAQSPGSFNRQGLWVTFSCKILSKCLAVTFEIRLLLVSMILLLFKPQTHTYKIY